MTSIADSQLFQYASAAVDKVVLITGGGNGIGKEAALTFASFGAKVVIGDIDVAGAEATVNEIRKSGGRGLFCQCDVANWEDQRALYERGIQEYGSIDIVVANAGVGAATGPFMNIEYDSQGKPLPPKLTVLDVNLTGMVYTTHLALHYLTVNRTDLESLKSIVLMGSMASWIALPRGELYAASKHAALGLMRSLHPSLEKKNIRISIIHPWYADTGILTVPLKIILAGIPLTPVPRIAGAIFYSATDPDWGTSGSAWLLTHDGPVLLVHKEQFKEGVYKMVDERSNKLMRGVSGFVYWVRLVRDLGRIFPTQLLVGFVILVFATILFFGTL